MKILNLTTHQLGPQHATIPDFCNLTDTGAWVIFDKDGKIESNGHIQVSIPLPNGFIFPVGGEGVVVALEKGHNENLKEEIKEGWPKIRILVVNPNFD